VIAAVLFIFCPLRKGYAEMKFTPQKGLFRLAIVVVLVLVCLPVAKEVALHTACTILFIGWLFCWVIGGFFDMD
jgi:hypothetical protein